MKILKRDEVNILETWDLSDLYPNDESFYLDLDQAKTSVDTFKNQFEGKIKNAQFGVDALRGFEKLQENLIKLSTYATLYLSQDQSNPTSMERSGRLAMVLSDLITKVNFVEQELLQLDETILNEMAALDEDLKRSIEILLRKKPHALKPEIEDAISSFNQSLNAPYQIYNTHKLVDMKFDDIEVEGKTIPMTFGYFEDELAFSNDVETRHKAFETFHKRLAQSQNTVASVYQSHVLKEKAMAKLKGFDNTIDYLLFDQEVSRDMYDRQIDLIMTHLAPAMRKFANLLKDIHGLDKMTSMDLHLVVDPDFEPNISIEESKTQLLEGLKILGDDYQTMIKRAFDERWIDFPQNQGKSTGAFCSSPYGVHPYILISWTQKMREVFVLAHELGHAGHFYLAGKNQSLLNTRASLYIIEAPSTMNELLMANHLKASANDPRLKRWILSTLISRTYYHNFVTHLLEAAYQREVYLAIDRGEPISAAVLNKIYKHVLESFWGDAVEISEGAQLTWMRQPHYYMGLYPYTYSAGLTIATQASEKLLNEEITIEAWKDVLKAGGTKSPLELAKMVNVDLSTEAPLMDTIKYIEAMIDEIIELTKIINESK